MLNILLVNERTGHEVLAKIEVAPSDRYQVFVNKLKDAVGKRTFYSYDIFETWES